MPDNRKRKQDMEGLERDTLLAKQVEIQCKSLLRLRLRFQMAVQLLLQGANGELEEEIAVQEPNRSADVTHRGGSHMQQTATRTVG